MYYVLSCHLSCHHHALHSFPTRRSSDLRLVGGDVNVLRVGAFKAGAEVAYADKGDSAGFGGVALVGVRHLGDRKSTRLKSSNQIITYAVLCLKKKISMK